MHGSLSLWATASAALASLLLASLGAGCVLQTSVGYGDGTTSTSSGAGGAGGGEGTGGGPNGAPELLVANDLGMNPWALAVDATQVYFTDAQGPNGKVLRVAKSGGPAAVIAQADSPTTLAVDATDVYFLDWTSVKKVPLQGGAVTTVAPAENSTYSGIVVDGENLYWTNYTTPGSTMQQAKAGGAPITLHAGSQYPSGVVVTGGRVVWSALSETVIRSTPIGGGPITNVASNQDGVRWGLTADSTHLYWITEGDFPMQLWSVPLDAATPPAQIGASPSEASVSTSLLVDDAYLYFSVECQIHRLPKGGGAVLTTTPAPALGCPRFMTHDAEAVYYTSDAGVTRYPKSAL